MRLIIFILSAYSAFAAVAATTVWEVRTTGNNNNGGGFNSAASGTDYSQQDSPQIVYTDLVIGGTTTQATSALNPFDATSPGNIVNVVSGAGCTVQRAQVLSVAGSTATFDKALGTAASTCAGNLGGALASWAPLMNNLGSSIMVSSNKVWTKSGTYSFSTGLLAYAINAVAFYGYETTRGDGGARPLITSATNSLDLVTFSGGAGYNTFENIDFSHTAATRGKGFTRSGGGTHPVVACYKCKFSGFSNAIADASGAYYSPLILRAVEITATTGAAITFGQSGGVVRIFASYIHDNGGVGVSAVSGSSPVLFLNDTIIADSTGDGINSASATAVVYLQNCTITGNTGDGIQVGSTNPVNFMIVNSILYSNGAYGINFPSASEQSQNTMFNAYGSNTSGNVNNGNTGTSPVTLTASPFTDSANQDYSLNSTAGGGAAVRSAGYPGAFPGGLTTGYMSIGAVIPSSASSAATLAYPFVQ